jgi:hypothetical protein
MTDESVSAIKTTAIFFMGWGTPARIRITVGMGVQCQTSVPFSISNRRVVRDFESRAKDHRHYVIG